MSKDILRGTSWPLTRVVTTAQRVALQASQAQINNLPVGFLVEEIEANIFVALWVRDTLAVGGLRQLVTNGPITLAGDVTGASNNNTVSLLQGQTLTITGPIAAGEVLAPDAGGTAIVNADIATVLGYDPAANLGALGIPDPTGAPDGQAIVTAGGAYGLATPAGGIDTSLQAAPDTGWTAVGTASIASGVATLTLGPSDTLARLYRTAPTSPNAPMLEVIARVRRTQAPDGTNHGVGIGLANEAFDAGYYMDARPDNSGQVQALYNEQGGWQLINGVNFISPGAISAPIGASSVWIRIVATPYSMAFYTDTGATRPTDWGRLGRLLQRNSAVIPLRGWMTTLVILAVRGAGTGTAIFEVDQIQWRSLLGAPT